MVGIALSVATVFHSSALVIHWFAVARQAQQAAELAALAGAGAAVEGRTPCEAAASVAVRNEVRMVQCLIRGQGRSVVVEITVEERVTSVVPGAPDVVRRSATAAS